MITYKYYKFPNKESVPQKWPSNVDVSHVGRIISKYPKYDSFIRPLTEIQYLPGWHVNVCYQGEADLSFVQEYEITVNNPICKWMGQP